ncbi:10340_t:CDS:2, partial [Racocetra fulgida]
ADIYGLDVIITEMSSGQRPFDGRLFDLKLSINICKDYDQNLVMELQNVTLVKEKLKICNIEQFFEIVDKLLADNTVAIHVTSVPIAYSRIIAKKYASLPSNILFTNIRELDDVIEEYFLMKQDSVRMTCVQ